MDLIVTNQEPTMTSREMADLVEKRHDSVKRTIEALAARGAIGVPQSVEYLDTLGRTAHEYKVGKRDSYVIVAQLSPEFTARLVDRWQELEAGAAVDPMKALADPAALRQMLLGYTEKVLHLEAKVAAAAPALEFVGRFVEAKSSKCLSDVAKLLGWKPQAFIAALNADTVIFKRGGNWLPFQAHIDAGRFTVKAGEASGHAFQQTRVEPAGIAWLASRYPAPAKV